MFVLGIIGPAGVGKSYAAELVRDQFDYHKNVAFAERLKEIAFDMGWDGRKDDRGRRLLQLLGTECGRECIGEDIWINFWAEKVIQCEKDGRQVVTADDARFHNEIAIIHKVGGKVLKLVGRGYDAESKGGHESERYWDELPHDYLIENVGDRFRLEAEIKRMLIDFEWRSY